MFVELENTSDNLIVLDETWLYTCKADKETTATWHFPLIDGAFYRTASRFYPGERVILYAGSEPVYALQYDAQGQYTGKEVCAEGLDQIAEEMRSASLLRVRINSRPYVTDAMLEWAKVEPYAYMFREDVDAL